MNKAKKQIRSWTALRKKQAALRRAYATTEQANDALWKTSSNQKSFNFISFVVCMAFVVYFVQYEQPGVNSLSGVFNNEEEDEIVTPETFTNSCRPRKNIVFLKTHKCASSSIQNIFTRYGYRHGLTFVLPAKGSYIGHPEPFNWSMVPDARKFGLRYNILTHHCRFNYEEMKRNFPNDVVFVTIVRQPVELYESLFSFYSLHRFYKERFDTLVQKGKHFGMCPDLARSTVESLLTGTSETKLIPNERFQLGFRVTGTKL
ncbi:Galactosylceramide sulfotransferase, partial [Stegodyphus mimosarum]